MGPMKMGKEHIDLAESVSLLGAGEAFSVFIDDTGTAGNTAQEVVRYVAVVVAPDVSPSVPAIMELAMDEIHPVTGASELHFKDIYHGKGEFEALELQTRLEVFRAFVSIFEDTIKPVILVQSATPALVEELQSAVQLPELPPPLSLESTGSFAFLYLLTRVSSYIEQTRSGNQKAVAFCDQGLCKPGLSLYLPTFSDVLHQGLVHFVDSSAEPGIQLADFAAFVLNRHQLLARKETLNSLDTTFLLITQPLGQFFANVEARSTNIEYDPYWHTAYILQERFRGTDTLIVDERTGIFLLAEFEGEDPGSDETAV